MYTREDLSEMQAWSLERKIQVTQTRIIEWYQKFNGKVYISFSGGKDSTVLLDITRKIYPDIPAVFFDTGMEFPEVRALVKTYDNVEFVRPKRTFKEVIDRFGYPAISKEVAQVVYDARTALEKRGGGGYALAYLNGERIDEKTGMKSPFCKERWKFMLDAPFKISDRCCTTMKKAPSKNYSKKHGMYPIVATMASESARRQSAWLRYGCNAFDAKQPTSKPMSFWTEQDVLQYIVRYNLPIAEPYGDIIEKDGKLTTTGVTRTGCMYCLFGIHLEKSPNRLELLKETHPKVYDYVMKPESEGGLGYKEKIDWMNEHGNLHIKY